MNNPLNELSAVYNQSIAEGCGCDEKKKEKKEKSMEEGLAPGDVDQKVGAVTSIPKDEREAAKARLLAKAKAKRDAKLKEEEEKGKIGGGNLKKLATKATKRVDSNVDGVVDSDDMKSSEMGEYVPSPDGKKKVKTKARFESYSSWRTDLREIVGNPADAENTEQPSPKKQEDSTKEIKEKNIKNKIKINPPQGVTEGFEELGGVVVEMYELDEASYEEISAKIDKQKAAEKASKDKRMTITHADKKANTPAYQNYMKGDKRYKMQEMSIKDQMRISQEYNRKSSEDKKEVLKKALSSIKRSTPKKDTRTDIQKMTDATGPRPGSRYRGD